MMDDEEEKRLRAAALKNVEAILAARQRMERELIAAKEALERKSEELWQQREQFRVTLSSIGDAVITTDTQGNVTFMNPVAEAMTGWPQAEAHGRCLDEVFRVVDEETRVPVANPVNEVLRTGTVVGLADNTSLIRKDGATLAVEDSAAPIRDTAGNISGCVMVFHDVTQRRRAERALRANEDRLRDSARRLQLAMSAGDMGDWVWEAETNLLSLSTRAAQLFGLPANAPVSRDQLRALVPPEDGLRTRLEFDRALLEKTDYRVEFRLRRGNGPSIWVAARGRGVYADNGTVVGMIGMIQDITERRVSEELRGRLAAVVESSTDAVVSKTLESVITTWNHGAERLFGYKAEDVIGRPVTILIPPEHLDEEPVILERIKSGESVPPFQTVRLRKDGTRVDVSLAVSPIRDLHGRIIGASKIARDITPQKLAEAALRETDRRKDEFLATLAHELRNPLAPIRQAVVIAQSPGATDAQKRWSHDVINRQVHNMALLLDDLLDISRITRGTLALRTRTTDLASIVAAAVETARPLIDAKRHAFSMQLPIERIELAADPMRLAQVLSNLLTNAAKYTDPDGRIGLTASCDAGIITISVTDNGIGISPDAMDKLFGMFSQVRSSKDRSEGGLGIGLALAKALVELHGGTIEAQSPGTERGSEFIIRLPVRTQQTGQAEPSTRPGPERALGRRVLIADDNRDAAESLAMLLQMEGHEVTVVHDGREAVTAFEKMRPDAALLDIGMPGLNGYEIARIIRRAPHGRDITLVAVTGWGQENDKAQATEAGFNHHFTKPVEPDAITALLARPSSSDK
jgi:PAS domain S-box-containing protein